MEIGLTAAIYVVAAILFILSLGGLSGQESAKRAVWYGIVGMALAVAATLFGAGTANLFLTIVMIAFGAVAGYYVANRVQMTEMPQLVAALHSFVGLAAVFIGINAEIALMDVLAARASGATEAFSGFAAVLAHKTPAEIAMLKVEVFLGIFIGAVTFTGSIVAFGKLAGKIEIGIYDPTFYTAIEYLDDKDLVVAALPPGCGSKVVRPDPDEVIAQNQKAMDEAFMSDPNNVNAGMGKLFATKLELTCQASG